MTEQLFRLPEGSRATLRNRVREMLVAAILDGHIPVGAAVPPSRKLAQQLKVGRNTILFVYDQLVDEGYLVARERLGYFVADDIADQRLDHAPTDAAHSSLDIASRFQQRPSEQRNISKPRNWQHYPYPFVYGQVDPELFPIAEWRDCGRQALTALAIQDWTPDRMDADHPELIEQIRTRLLPRRGVWAAPEEILVTLGAQLALYILADLLVSGKRVGMEEPGYPDARNIFALRAEHVQPLPVDEHGLVVSSRLENLDYVYTTPSHQSPTTVTMPLQRRQALLGSASDHDFLVIEDDYETGTQYVGQAIPALKSLDKTGRVIYVGSLSKSLAPGLRLGYMVASEDLIHEARALRRLILRHPPVNNQLAIALFLSQGHHDLLLRRLRSSYQERWRVLGDALAQYLPELTCSPSLGGSSYWLSGPPRLNCKRLQREAALSGVLIEPGDVFFMSEDSEQTYLRLGFSSIPVQQIEPGIKTLAKVVRAQL